MVRVVDMRLIENLPIRRKALTAANKIFGPDLNALKGKTVSQKTYELQVEIASVSMAFTSLYQQVTVASDMMFVNWIPFLISISLQLKLVTVERLEVHRVTPLVEAVHTIKKTFALQGFKLAFIKMDPEFEPLRTDLDDYNILLNVCAKN